MIESIPVKPDSFEVPTSGDSKKFANHRSSRNLELIVGSASLVFSVVLISRLLLVVLTTGGNCLTNDYQYCLTAVNGVLHAGLDLPALVKNCFQNSHFVFLPSLVFCLNAALFEWDPRIDAVLGVVLAVIRSYVLYRALTFGSLGGIGKWLIFLVVFGLTFGSTSLSCFDFGVASLTGGVGFLAFMLGFCGLVRYAGEMKGSLLMLVGGVLTALCAGYWPAAWASYVTVLFLQRIKRPQVWIVVAVGLVLSALPAIMNTVFQNGESPKLVALWNWSFLINTLGRCFANKIGMTSEPLFLSELAGWVGLVFMAVVLLAPLRRSEPRYSAAVGLGIFGLASIWMTSLFRTGIAPWYAGFAVYVWIAVLTLAALCVDSRFSDRPRPMVKRGFQAAGGVIFLVTAVLYSVSNVRISDKDFWAETRTEASDSCVRNYLEAPTYSERTIFLGHVGDFSRFIKVAKVLNDNMWSACSHNQNWSLQGDYILSTVVPRLDRRDARIHWVSSKNDSEKKSWNSPEHLDLFVSNGASLWWRLDIPSACRSAVLQTFPKSTDGVLLVKQHGRTVRSIALAPLDRAALDLKDWSGSQIEIGFVPGSAINGVVFAHPVVAVNLTNDFVARSGHSFPSNTDASPHFPQRTEFDYTIHSSKSKSWSARDMKQVSLSQGEWTTQGTQPKLTLNEKISISPIDYSHLVFEVKAGQDVVTPRAACVGFVVNEDRFVQRLVPLLPDASLHGYSYDLKLLELEPGERITGLELLPVYVRSPNEVLEICIGDIRFVRRSN